MRACVTERLVCRGSHLKILRSMRRVRKQAEETELICDFIVSLWSMMILRFLAWLEGVGTGLRSDGHQESFH